MPKILSIEIGIEMYQSYATDLNAEKCPQDVT